MRGLSLMIRQLTRMILGVFSQSVSYIGLTMVVSLAGLEIYLALNNWAWLEVSLLMLLIVIWPLTLLWLDGEKESRRRSEVPASPGLLWEGGADSLVIQCPHCGKHTTTPCKV